MVVGNSKNAPTNLGMPIGTTQGLLITTVSAKLHLKTTVFACPTSTQWQNPRVFRAFSAFSAPFSVIAENAENARKTRGFCHSAFPRFFPRVSAFSAITPNSATRGKSRSLHQRQSAQLIGDLPWESIQCDDSRFQPIWCMYCSTSDVESQFDKDSGMWIGTCNLCGMIIR